MLQVKEEGILPFFVFYISFMTPPTVTQRVRAENTPYKSKIQHHPGFQMARFPSLHLKSTWALKKFVSDGKMTEKSHRASDWHWASRDWRKTLFGAHAWRCRGKLGTARAHSLNSPSLCWPSTSTPNSAPHRHQHSLPGSAAPGTGTWRGMFSITTYKVTLCFPVFAKPPNTQEFTHASTFPSFFFFLMFYKKKTKITNRNYLTSSLKKLKGKDSNTSSHKLFERSWFCSH